MADFSGFVQKDLHNGSIDFTAAGTAPEFHRIPFPGRGKYQRTHKDNIYFHGLDFFDYKSARGLMLVFTVIYLGVLPFSEQGNKSVKSGYQKRKIYAFDIRFLEQQS